MSASHRNMINVDLSGKAGLYQNAPLKNWEIIGTVTRNNFDTGALVRNTKTGIYCQANAGSLRSLPQDKIIKALI